MIAPRHLRRWARRTGRRTATAALLALQVGIALSPLVERREPGHPVVHVHEPQSEHLFPHDESRCALCAARTMVAQTPADPDLVRITDGQGGVVLVAPLAPLAREPASEHRSRAPPVLT